VVKKNHLGILGFYLVSIESNSFNKE